MADISSLNYTEAEDFKNSEFSLAPAGVYKCMVTDSGMRNDDEEAKRANKKPYIFLQVEIVEGEHSGSKIWDNLFIFSSEKAIEMANRKLKSISTATKKMDAKETDEFHDIVFEAKIGIEVGKNGYKDKNVINEYIALGSSNPSNSNVNKESFDDDIPF